MRDAWDILGLEPTVNKRQVKKAYARKLAQYHPEDHPEEFKLIQEAYSYILKTMNRDYSTSSANMDIEHDLLNRLQTETTIYDDSKPGSLDSQEETFPQRSDFDCDLASLYDDFNLSHNFEHIKSSLHEEDLSVTLNMHEHQEKKKQTEAFLQEDDMPDTSFQRVFTEEELAEITFQKFMDHIRFSCDLKTMQKLILNQRFYDMCAIPEYFIKTCKQVLVYIESCDRIVLSFLFDVFTVLEKEYSLYDAAWSVPDAIRDHQMELERKQKRKKLISTITLLAACLILIVILIVSQFEHKKQYEEKKALEKKTQELWNDRKKEQGILSKEAVFYAQTKLEETSGISYSCYIPSTMVEADKEFMMLCRPQDNSDLVTLYMIIDADGNVINMRQLGE